MKARLLPPLLALIVVTLWAPASNAQNWRSLKYAPIAYFTDQDWQIFTKAGTDALNDQPDGATSHWENPATGASGSITPIRTNDSNGAVCREVKITNSANQHSSQNIFILCKQPDGTWKFNG